MPFGRLVKVLFFASLGSATPTAGALAALPEGLSNLAEGLERHELAEVRVYSSQPHDNTVALYEFVPDESYVVDHPAIMCKDRLTAEYARELADRINNTVFTKESDKYAVDWVLQFYDRRGVKSTSVLMGTGGSAGKSDPWHVELDGISFAADGPIRNWLVSHYPHAGCKRFELSTSHR